MTEAKTIPTAASVASYLAAISDAARRADCRVLAKLMQQVTGERPEMWGPSIVGFGSYHYRYASGREGDSCAAGFSSRKGDITIYLMADAPERAQLLSVLGAHKTGKACLYIRRMSDIDSAVLAQLIASSVAEIKRRYG